MTTRAPRRVGASIVALGLALAFTACGSEEMFTLQLAATERVIDTEAIAQLSNEKSWVNGLRVVGDIDGDGIDDAIIATFSGLEAPAVGSVVFVLYGGSQLAGEIDLASLPSLTLATGAGATTAKIAAVGDIDGDGLADVLLSAAADCETQGGTYLVYGSRTRLTGAAPIASAAAFLRDPEVCTNMNSMAALGDFDGDGRADFAIGRSVLQDPQTHGPSSEPNEVLVFYGRSARLAGTVDLLATADARIIEPSTSSTPPFLVATGDVDGDGLDDLVVTANSGVPASSWSMELRLVTGSATRLAGTVAVGDVARTRLPDSTCLPTDAGLGTGLGDLDGDGADDFSLIGCGSTMAPFNTYVHHVFYGRPGGMPAQLTDADAAATVQPGFSFQSGSASQLIGGDVDGDGHLDLILADESLHDSQGGVHLIRGGKARFSGTIVPTTDSYLTYVGVPFQLPSCSGKDCSRPELAGEGVGVGDLTGDHRADLIVGARPYVDPNRSDLGSLSRIYVLSPSAGNKP